MAAGLALLGAGFLAAPLRWTHPDVALPLDVSAAAVESGHAFLMPFACDRDNDRDGSSELRLFEDGRELGPAHAPHASIRATGGGAFSHWGESLYFSTSDDSDPRSNGRHYEARLPPRLEAAMAVPGLVVMCLAAALALFAALAVTRTRPASSTQGVRRWPAWVLAGVLVAVAAFLMHAAFRARESRTRLSELQSAFTEPAAVSQPAPQAARANGGLRPPAAAAPRTLRLLDAPDALAFRATGAPPVLRLPVAVAFPESVSLAPGAEVASSTPLDLREEDVAELQITLRVRQGKRLALHFAVREEFIAGEAAGAIGTTDGEAGSAGGQDGEFRATMEVPVAPSDEWQTLLLSQPLVLAGQQDWAGRVVRVVGLSLGNIAQASDELQLELRAVAIAGQGALFSRATHGSGRVAVGDDLRLAWWQSTAGELTLPLAVSAGRSLRGAVALLDPEGAGGAASYRVEAEDAHGSRSLLQSGKLEAAQGWLEWKAELPGDMVPARIVIGSDALPEGRALAWSALRCVDLSRPAQRVVLVLVDTLRADATGCCGGPGDATPALDALADQGASFTRCYSQASWTRPSMPSIFTGRHVAATGVQHLGQRLPARYETLAESFASAGFHTLSFVTNTNAGPAAGLDQGFDEVLIELDRDVVSNSARFLDSFVSPRLEQLPDDDLFVSVHLMEVHAPFGPPTQPPGWVAPSGQALTFDRHFDRAWVDSPTDASRRQLYALDVASLDRALGAFFARWLGAWERADNLPVTIAVASDHGEFLGEDDRWGHAWGTMLEPVLHVPLVLRAPGQIEPGSVCSEVVQNVDIGITLQQLAGVARHATAERGSSDDDGSGLAGRSLLPLLKAGRRAGPTTALAGLETGPSRLFTVITPDEWLAGENGRLVAASAPGAGTEPVRSSPLTRLDVLLAREPGFGLAWDRYLGTQRAWRRKLWENSASEPVTMDAGALEQLQALGYLGR